RRTRGSSASNTGSASTATALAATGRPAVSCRNTASTEADGRLTISCATISGVALAGPPGGSGSGSAAKGTYCSAPSPPPTRRFRATAAPRRRHPPPPQLRPGSAHRGCRSIVFRHLKKPPRRRLDLRPLRQFVTGDARRRDGPQVAPLFAQRVLQQQCIGVEH